MTEPDWIYEQCPFLPEIDRVYTAVDLADLGEERSEPFYETALRLAQSYWRTGFPAKALLMCNRAFSARLSPGASVLKTKPWPYRAVAWILVNRMNDRFIGNPRRHFQHLATRMVEPQKELRVWRAWACWYLAKELLDEKDFPPDAKQIVEEDVIEPTRLEIGAQLDLVSNFGDRIEWEGAVKWSTPWRRKINRGAARVKVQRIPAADLKLVREMALQIWPAVYSEIISAGQIEYMLRTFYTLEKMGSEMETKGVCYAVIQINGRPGGYLSFEVLRGECCAFLHKLYLAPQHHGMGAGSEALGWVEKTAAKLGLAKVKLRVNKQNALAIRSYRRNGFQFAGEETSDIGGGFVMDDYWMEKRLK